MINAQRADRKRVQPILGAFLLIGGLLMAGFIAYDFGMKSQAASPIDPSQLNRAMWVWDKYETVKKILEDDTEAEALLRFCRSPHEGLPSIRTVFIDTQKYHVDMPDLVAKFIRKAHAQGLRVEYLSGSPNWAVLPQKYTLRVVDRVLAYNKGRAQAEQFDGISFDIEPYLLGNWKRKRTQISEKYIALLKTIYEHIKKEEPDLIFNVAVPVFFSEPDPDGRILTFDVLKYTDYVVAMDYRDKGERIISEGRPFLKHAAQAGKIAIIAVETYDVVSNNEGVNYLSFHEEGWEIMEKELAKVTNAFQDMPGFGGIAIHYYNSYKELQQENVNKTFPVPILSTQRTTKPMQLDGSLKSFAGLTPIPIGQAKNVVYTANDKEKTWGGTEDLSAKVYVTWDPEALYVGLDVTDNEIRVTPDSKGGGMWVDDHIELWLAPEPDIETSSLTQLYQIGFSPGNFAGQVPYAFVWVPDDLAGIITRQIKVVTQKTSLGYHLEAKIPLSVLGNWNPEEDPRIRFLVDVSDTDRPGAKQELLMSLSEFRKWGDPNTFAKLSLKGNS